MMSDPGPMIAAPAAAAARRGQAARDSWPLTRSLRGLRLAGASVNATAPATAGSLSKCHCASDGPDSETRGCPGHFKYRDLKLKSCCNHAAT
jgi:hypothetical protein